MNEGFGSRHKSGSDELVIDSPRSADGFGNRNHTPISPSSFSPIAASTPNAKPVTRRKTMQSSSSDKAGPSMVDRIIQWPSVDTLVCITLFMMGAMTRGFALPHPSRIVFDETHFAKFFNWSLLGEYYIDIHPPLAKLLMMFVAKYFAEFEGSVDAFEDVWSSGCYVYIRGLAAFFGAMLVPVMYMTCRNLGMSREASWLGACLLLCENLIIVESRHILTDSYLYFFIGLSLCCSAWLAKEIPFTRRWVLAAIMTGASLGGAMTVKFTALGVFGTVGVHQFFTLCRDYVIPLTFGAGHGKVFTEEGRVKEANERGGGRDGGDLPVHKDVAVAIGSLCLPKSCRDGIVGGGRTKANKKKMPSFGGDGRVGSKGHFRNEGANTTRGTIAVRLLLDTVLRGVLILGVFALVFMAVFWMHFHVLPYHGQGDGFMTRAFRDTLRVKPVAPTVYSEDQLAALPTGERLERLKVERDAALTYKYQLKAGPELELPFTTKLKELLTTMWSINIGLNAGHFAASKWYTWPLTQGRLVPYWTHGGATPGTIKSQPNALVHWITLYFVFLTSVVFAIGVVIYHLKLLLQRGQSSNNRAPSMEPRLTARSRKNRKSFERGTLRSLATYNLLNAFMILVGFYCNLVPFMWIERSTWNYHYVPALMFAMLAAAHGVDVMIYWADASSTEATTHAGRRKRARGVGALLERFPPKVILSRAVLVALSAAVIYGYFYWAPSTYGLAMSREDSDSRIWLPEWVGKKAW
eukprot:TRINITY_DN9272_c0_g1_i1.p1 TRINITY_DN9272_c0_g1~~TRINITY_DN9272_c0_g1_i1.p1  ORF type:complete len:750 (-),score=115.47 TRINITY_DN9272_c0_g1_i1:40-2289(-)